MPELEGKDINEVRRPGSLEPGSSQVQKLKLRQESERIDLVTQVVDLMEANKITLGDVMDEWYLRKVG